MSEIDEIMAALDLLDPDEREKIIEAAAEFTSDRVWINNPGPQLKAIECEADELFYGGEAGGGKTDLLCGLAIEDHHRSLLLRRQNTDTLGLETRLYEILSRAPDRGWKKRDKVWRCPDESGDMGLIKVDGCQYEHDKENNKGQPYDLYGFDEIADFTESQYRFITGWNRSTKPGQRCRVIAAGNPPTRPEGFWVVRYWAPWLDPSYPNPAEEGELRWFTTINGKDVECEGPDPVEVDGEWIKPRSRSFIRARLSDNPDLADTNYAAVLAALPPEYRRAYKEGRFDVNPQDDPQQLIPTSWVQEAMARWREEVPDEIPMTTLAHDVALGGGVANDSNVYARRHGLWFDKLIVEPNTGEKIDPIDLAGRIVTLMRDECAIAIDMGGGYGSGVYSHLKNNVAGLGMRLIGHDGSGETKMRDRSGKLKLGNARTAVYWSLRDALEPHLGQPVMLPPDPELLADLTAIRKKPMSSRGIFLESKEDIRKRLGRSTDKGDAVAMAWFYGEAASNVRIRRAMVGTQLSKGGGPKVNLGHSKSKRR